MMEGERANFNADNPEPLMDPTEYPLVGASIAPPKDRTNIRESIGSLGGYIVADGTVYALTNHHVVFGDHRTEPFPSPTEISDSVIIHQPPKGDLDREIGTEEKTIAYLKHLLKGANRGKTYELQTKSREERLAMLREWYDKPLALGAVTRSSGLSTIPVLQRSRNWAVIKVGDDDRGTADTTKFINEASVLLHPNSMQTFKSESNYL
jgi:hypothetical protein